MPFTYTRTIRLGPLRLHFRNGRLINWYIQIFRDRKTGTLNYRPDRKSNRKSSANRKAWSAKERYNWEKKQGLR